jgi:enoyl-CoA hydratase/carnithine racemase
VFATPGVNIGLFCSTPMVALSRNASSKHAMEMLLTGDPITAVQAAQKGIITQSLEGAELAKHVLEKANKIASKSSKTLKIGKGAYYRQSEMPLDQAYDYASQVMVENMLEQDAKEGIDAFLEKRTPQWEE